MKLQLFFRRAENCEEFLWSELTVCDRMLFLMQDRLRFTAIFPPGGKIVVKNLINKKKSV